LLHCFFRLYIPFLDRPSLSGSFARANFFADLCRVGASNRAPWTNIFQRQFPRPAFACGGKSSLKNR